MKLGFILAAGLALAAPIGEAAAQQQPRTRIEGSRGEIVGTARPNNRGGQDVYDRLGRRRFSTERTPSGSVITRDPQGRRISPQMLDDMRSRRH